VETLVFLGSFFRAELSPEGMGPTRLRADLPVELVRRLGVSEGAALAVVLPRERLRVYPQSALR
jgi:iron(III) transport system ATP-binding protein